MTDTLEFCESCYLEMDEVIDDLWLCRDEDRPHLWLADDNGWSRTFEEIHQPYAAELAQALLAERKQGRAGWLLLAMALDC